MLILIGIIFAQDSSVDDLLTKARLGVKAAKYAEVVGSLRKIKETRLNNSEVYDLLGTSEFMLGNTVASCQAFDDQIKMRPQDGPSHWRRGIALYYAGRFAHGQKQFESYQAVDGNDVENTVWKLMCQTRAPGQSLEKARKQMLPIGFDRRVPMMKILDLFGGNAKVDDVENAVSNGAAVQLESGRFYRDLYLGLWEDLNGRYEEAGKHLAKAGAGTAGSDYMREVALVHLKLLKEKKLPWQNP